MTTTPPAHSTLPDAARCRIILADPPLADATALIAALGRLLAQFAREERVTAWTCTAEQDGAAIVLAWMPDTPLSGCSHDKIHGVLTAHEGRSGSALLAPPPICVRIDGAWRCVDRAGLRRLATPDTPMLDHRLERLGDWRRSGCTTVGASWAAAILAPRPGTA